jgi:hypothetical protein
VRIGITYFPKLRSSQGQRVITTWERLCSKLVYARTATDKHDVPGISLATYREDRRSLDRVERVFAVGLDLDKGVDWERLLDVFEWSDAFLHTTHSSTPEATRARVFLRLSRPVTGDEYRRVYRATVSAMAKVGLEVDRAASDPSRELARRVPTRSHAEARPAAPIERRRQHRRPRSRLPRKV